MRAVLVLSLLVAASTPALAGTADAPEMTDPAGDAGPMGAAIPAGVEDVDLVAAWFDTETDTTIDLVLKTAGALRNRPATMWAQTFDANGTSYLAGYIDVLAGVPQFGFQGHFVCLASEVPDSCLMLTGTNSGDTIRLTLPRDNISSPMRGAAITIASGLVVSSSFYGPDGVPWDTTPAGLPYIFEKGPGGSLPDDPDAPALPGEVTNTTVAPTADAQPSGGEQNAVPAPGLALVAAALGLLALARRRS